MLNSHNEMVLRDGEAAELGPGQCACGQARARCAGCEEWADCGECGAPGRCGCEQTIELPPETMAQLVWGQP